MNISIKTLTRLGIISDVHANLPALRAVLRCLEAVKMDAISCTGGLIGSPYPNETIKMLHEQHAVIIRGNTDSGFIDFCRGRAPNEWYHAQQYALMRWSTERIEPETLAWLESLPEERIFTTNGGQIVHIAHGAPGNPTHGLDPLEDVQAVERAARASRGSLLVVGHSHRPWSGEVNSTMICNPGAVCGPLDGTNAVQYALAEWNICRWSISLQSAPYDLADIRSDFAESGLLQAGGPLARAFLCSIETGRDVTREFLGFAFTLAGPGYSVVPDEIWEKAANSFTWTPGPDPAYQSSLVSETLSPLPNPGDIWPGSNPSHR